MLYPNPVFNALLESSKIVLGQSYIELLTTKSTQFSASKGTLVLKINGIEEKPKENDIFEIAKNASISLNTQITILKVNFKIKSRELSLMYKIEKDIGVINVKDSEEIVNSVLGALSVQLDSNVKFEISKSVQRILGNFQNQAYAKGFEAGKNMNIDPVSKLELLK